METSSTVPATSASTASPSSSEATLSSVAPIISRIDPPHGLNDTPASDSNPVAVPVVEEAPAEDDFLASAGRSQEHLAEQLHAQALQLAEHLRAKQREIDRREALMNAREAKLENELRLGRLWIRERDQDVAEREQQYAKARQALDDKAAQIAAVELSVDHDSAQQQVELSLREQAFQKREQLFREQETRLQQERAALRTAEARLEQQRARLTADQQLARQKQTTWQVETEHTLARQLRNIEQASRALDEREAQLEARLKDLSHSKRHEAVDVRLASREELLAQSETLLSRHAHEIDQERAKLAAHREQQLQEARDQRQELAAWQQRERVELAARKEQLDVAAEVLEKHRAAAEQLRTEAAKMHREAIEMRLVSEQLWLELSHHAPPAELTQSLAALRQRLAENYRGAKEHVAEQKAEMQRLATRLDDQQKKLVEHREQIRAWQTAQQQEIETQAARLVQRELELDRQEKSQRLEQTRWTNERRELQQEIRRLLGRVRELEEQGAGERWVSASE